MRFRTPLHPNRGRETINFVWLRPTQHGRPLTTEPTRLIATWFAKHTSNRKNVNKSKGPNKCPGLRQIGGVREGLFVLFGLLFRRRQAFETLQELFLGHALDRDLGIVGIDAGSCGTNQGHRIGFWFVDLDELLQGVNQFFAQVFREIEESAISRSETTGFLSLSRSTVSCDPDEIIRARCAANRTKSNRLSTLSMQSSTVTRAMNCRSVVWGPIC